MAPDQHYNTGNGLSPVAEAMAYPDGHPPRVPTDEEAEAILLLVKSGWLRLELTLND